MQKSKIQSWCESIIEAGWLAALIVAPLFFNVYSSRVFEPDKISLIRSIALVMLFAYLVKLADGGMAWLPAYAEDGSEPEAVPADVDDPRSWYYRLLRFPFLLPVALLVVAYIISTLLSVAPRVSWWGSYQRLQGTYTFLSYIIIAVLTAAHLRRPQQLRRLQHTVILTSLPIAIYGVIQHYRIDPLPWGGDVVTRVSGNAGNPIFLAAYLIMAVFLTLERIYSSFAYLLSVDLENGSQEGAFDTGHDLPSALAGGSYLFVLIVQLLAIFWTQSRGPWLGLAAGLYLFVLLLVTGLRPAGYRAWTAGWVGMGIAGVVLLVLMNTTSLFSFLEPVPYVGRLTTMLQSESGTGRVRVLIWEGVSQMVAPHKPLVYPDGEPDAINPIRPLVGYGPEAMWVAYNAFYPPELGQIEARNASPDRSHNETWDSLATTGILGFLAYVMLFFAIFYWTLRWLGLITNRRDVYLFSGLWLGGGVLLSLVFHFYDQSWRFFGVALPMGFIAGLITYVTLAVFIHPEAQIEESESRRHLLIIAILATIAAHFVEIHFGIAIAATRTYFWVLTALLLVLGMQWLQPESFANASAEATTENRPRRSSKRRARGRRAGRSAQTGDAAPALPATVMSDLLVMLTLAYLYTTNFQGKENPLAILFDSLTTRMQDNQAISSPGILFLLVFTWLIATTIGLSVAALRQSDPPDTGWWLRGYGLYSLVLWGGWLIYGLIQAGRLVPGAAGTQLAEQLAHIAGHFSLYTWLTIAWMAGTGLVLAWTTLREPRRTLVSRAALTLGGGTLLAVIIFAIVSTVNVALVKADVFYKQGQQFDSNGDWVGSIELYRRALKVRPSEDHYMLFLGRSLLEQAKRAPAETSLQMPQEFSVADVLQLNAQEVSQMSKEDLLRAAKAILERAQAVNPLNTDHTANLARLYRSWADLAETPEERSQALQQSLDYYETALQLSPHAAHLWNEKGATLMLMDRPDEAEAAYLHSLSLDARFENTYLLLAELYEKQGENDKLRQMLNQGLEKLPRSNQLRSFLGVAQARSGDLDGALETNLAIIDRNPNDFNAARNLAILYRDLDQPQESIRWANRALELADNMGNDAQVVQPLRQLLADLYSSQGKPDQVIAQYEAMRQLSPQDPALLNQLATLYLQNQRMNEAVEVLQTLTTLEPDNFAHPLRLAQIFAQNGQVGAARQFGEQALALAPADQKATIQDFLNGLEQ